LVIQIAALSSCLQLKMRIKTMSQEDFQQQVLRKFEEYESFQKQVLQGFEEIDKRFTKLEADI
jgi:hypothetical protein